MESKTFIKSSYKKFIDLMQCIAPNNDTLPISQHSTCSILIKHYKLVQWTRLKSQKNSMEPGWVLNLPLSLGQYIYLSYKLLVTVYTPHIDIEAVSKVPY